MVLLSLGMLQQPKRSSSQLKEKSQLTPKMENRENNRNPRIRVTEGDENESTRERQLQYNILWSCKRRLPHRMVQKITERIAAIEI